MKHPVAFAGFRHYHIIDLYDYAKTNDRMDIVAAAENDPQTAADLSSRGVTLTHDSVESMLSGSEGPDFEVVAIGDYYTNRGNLALMALRAGKHVILDKPVCTSLDELDAIRNESLKRGLAVGCMLNNRDAGQFITLKGLIEEGRIGKIQTINFMGHHPLLYGTRPSWYFEEGKHGGTINDIAIHAIDIIPWLTGLAITEVTAARVWNSRLAEHPHFQVGAQLMLKLEGGAGVIGDVSYLSPDSQGYTVPQYWRFTIHGTEGILETGAKMEKVLVWENGGEAGYEVPAGRGRNGGVYEDFLNEIEGRRELCDLTTGQVLDSAEKTLKAQQAADTETFQVKV